MRGRSHRRRSAVIAGATFAVLLGGLFPASGGAHNSVLIREVRPMQEAGQFPFPPPSPDPLAFVEIQSLFVNALFFNGYSVRTYGPDGQETGNFELRGNVRNADPQRTVLIGDSGVGNRDYLAPGLSKALHVEGGAACFFEALPPDCVSWGSFPPNATLTDPVKGSARTGTPVPGVQPGESIARTIARGCPTALDKADDTQDSAADFRRSAPTPRPNSTRPTEIACATCRGRKATIVGTQLGDVLRGTDGRDVIVGYGGHDKIIAKKGNDLICAGLGRDRVFGGAGRDRIFGEADHDRIFGGRHRDLLHGGGGPDLCHGGQGRDRAVSCKRRFRIRG